jgi:hypothetical protein
VPLAKQLEIAKSFAATDRAQGIRSPCQISWPRNIPTPPMPSVGLGSSRPAPPACIPEPDKSCVGAAMRPMFNEPSNRPPTGVNSMGSRLITCAMPLPLILYRTVRSSAISKSCSVTTVSKPPCATSIQRPSAWPVRSVNLCRLPR